MRNYQAANELERVANLCAFNVDGYATRRRINQHSVYYTFPDGSQMQLYLTRQVGEAWHPAWKGTAADIELGPIMGRALRVNR